MKELALHLLDLVENSIHAGAQRVSILVEENLHEDVLRFIVDDDGCGMNAEFLQKIRDPFATTQNKATGLGIPFLCQAAEQCDGFVDIQSIVGEGTRVEAVWRHSHWDRAPMGRMAHTITAFFSMSCRIVFRHRCFDLHGQQVWEVDLDSEEFGGTPFDVGTLQALKEFLENHYASGRRER